MGYLEDDLKKLILERYGSVSRFSDVIGIRYTTLFSILQRGILKANIENIAKIAKALDIDMNELVAGKIAPNKSNEPTTIAAHFDGDEYTEDELDEIKQFAQFVKSKRKDSAEHLLPNAAHVRTDIEVTEEMREHDEALMDEDH